MSVPRGCNHSVEVEGLAYILSPLIVVHCPRIDGPECLARLDRLEFDACGGVLHHEGLVADGTNVYARGRSCVTTAQRDESELRCRRQIGRGAAQLACSTRSCSSREECRLSDESIAIGGRDGMLECSARKMSS